MRADWPRAVDPDLVRQAIGGSQSAVERLWAAVQPRVRELVSRNIADETEATEVFADIRLAFLEKLSTVRDPGAFDAWLSRVARNRVVDRYRAARADAAVAEPPQASGEREAPTQAERPLLQAERRRRHAEIVKLLWEEVDELARQDRDIIRLVIRQNMTAAQAATHLRISVSAAKMRFYRAVRRLDTRVRRRLEHLPALAEYYSTRPRIAGAEK